MLRILLPLLGLALLAGCQPSPNELAPPPARIALNRELTIPAGAATVRLQYGHPVAMNSVQEVDPYCVFEINTVGQAPQQVKPGKYDVVGIQRKVEDFARMPMSPTSGIMGSIGADEASHMYFVTDFRLHSASEPGVRSLTCKSNQSSITSPNRHFLTRAEMQQAVGSYFSFEPR